MRRTGVVLDGRELNVGRLRCIYTLNRRNLIAGEFIGCQRHLLASHANATLHALTADEFCGMVNIQLRAFTWLGAVGAAGLPLDLLPL